MHWLFALGLAVLTAATPALDRGLVARTQPTIRVSQAWIEAPGGSTEATAFVTIDNGTMYDVYIVGAETEAAAVIELHDTPQGASAPAAVKEVSVPAYGRLEMSRESVHLRLASIARPLKAGDDVTLVLYTDGGERLAVTATVK
jgi:periplasmic copper chaperone A